MTRALALTPRATADVLDAWNWYEAQRAGLGNAFKAAVTTAIELLREHAEPGPVVHRELRRVLLPRFPFALYYRATDAAIEVRGCLHQRRHQIVGRRRT